MRPVDLDEVPLPDKLVAGCGIVLVVDLLFLPWQSIDLGLTIFTRSAVEAPYAVLGVLAVLVTTAVVVVTIVRAAGPETARREVPPGWSRAASVGAAGTLALVVLKVVLEPDALGVGAWIAVALAAGMAVGGRLQLRTERATPEAHAPGT